MEKTNTQSTIKEGRKKEIAIAGLKVFCEKGYAGATIEDIVKKAGCSHGLFYHYFNNKKEVFEETMRINRNNYDKDLDEKIENEPNCAEKLRILINKMFYDLKNDENFPYFYYFFVSQCFNMKESSFSPPKHSEDAPPDPPMAKFEKIFTEGQANGTFKSNHTAKECTILLSAIIQGTTLGYIVAPKDFQKQMSLPDTDFILDIFRKETL